MNVIHYFDSRHFHTYCPPSQPTLPAVPRPGPSPRLEPTAVFLWRNIGAPLLTLLPAMTYSLKEKADEGRLQARTPPPSCQHLSPAKAASCSSSSSSKKEGAEERAHYTALLLPPKFLSFLAAPALCLCTCPSQAGAALHLR